jgi:hypothetical protein
MKILVNHLPTSQQFSDACLGNFLFNNYRQALGILEEAPHQIEALTSGCWVTDAQFAHWLDEEHRYLQSKLAEPEIDVLRIEYVELLTKYNEARYD